MTMQELQDGLASARISAPKVAWVNILRALAILWIFLNHAVEQVFGGPQFSNPWSGWPPLQDRILQLAPIQGHGLLDWPINIVRYLGWTGDEGVQLFLILSGFGLTWSILKKAKEDEPLAPIPFYKKRFMRLYPMWWAVHLFFLSLSIFLHSLQINPLDPRFYLSMAGLRISPDTLYYISPAWWYFTLILQLYLIFPWLWAAIRKYGLTRTVVTFGALSFIIRGLGLLSFNSYLDAWSRGAIFITRLPEFLFGIWLAFQLDAQYDRVTSWLFSFRSLLLGAGIYLLGFCLAFFLLGMTLSPFLLGVGAFMILIHASRLFEQPWLSKIMDWISARTYSIYLVHHPIIILLVPVGLLSFRNSLVGVIAAIAATVILAVLLERGVSMVLRFVNMQKRQGRLRLSLSRFIVMVLSGIAVVYMLNFLIGQFDPQEILGWGERPALTQDSEFGWKLVPNQVTRLQWESYDYQVQSNELGFPGPLYPAERGAGVYRILVTGDAFSSAEGVDTGDSWPRILEDRLNGQNPGVEVQVLNFAITGYGPQQYLAVLEKFVPIYQPDLILVGFFVNDYQDVLISTDSFQEGIGFQLPSQTGIRAFSQLLQLRKYVDKHALQPIKSLMRGEINPYGYFWGQFSAFERGNLDRYEKAQPLVREFFAEILALADTYQSHLTVLEIPASIQVCSSSLIPYFPAGVDLSDHERFDLDLPQRVTGEIAVDLGLDMLDLRDVLAAVEGECPYQPANMHFSVMGHRMLADFLSAWLPSTYGIGEKAPEGSME